MGQKTSAQFHPDHAHLFDRLAASCESIVAVPGTVDFSPPYAVRYGGIGVVSKISRRAYVGAEPIVPGSPCEMGEVHYFHPETSSYESWPSDRATRFEKRLARLLDREQIWPGVRIHIVCELPFYRGLNLDSTVAAGIAAALFLCTGKLTPATLAELTGDFAEKRADGPASKGAASFERFGSRGVYRELFQLAWQIEALLTRYRPEGHHLHAAFTASEGCTLFVRQSRPIPDEVEELPGEKPFEEFHPCGYRLRELLTTENGAGHRGSRDAEGGSTAGDDRVEAIFEEVNPLNAFDAAIVSLGDRSDSEEAFAAHRKGFRGYIDYCARRSVQRIREKLPDALSAADDKLARFIGMAEESAGRHGRDPKATHAADCLMDLAVVKSMETFSTFLDMVEKGAPHEERRSLITCVDQGQDLYRLFDLSTSLIEDACSLLRSELRSLTRQGVGVRLMGAGGGGCLFVLAAKGSLATALLAALDGVRKQLPATNPTVIWTSYQNGYPPGGRAIEVVQHLPETLFSFPTTKSFIVRTWIGGVADSPQLFDRRSWEEKSRDFDTVLNFADKRLVLRNWDPRKKGAVYGTPESGAIGDRQDELEDGAASDRNPESDLVSSDEPALDVEPRGIGALRILFGETRTAARSVSCKSSALSDAAGTFESRAELDKVLKRMPEIKKRCRLRTEPIPGGKRGSGEYVLSASPDPAFRIALVWPWPRAESKANGRAAGSSDSATSSKRS